MHLQEYRVIRAIDTSLPTYNVSTVAGDKATEGYQDGTGLRVLVQPIFQVTTTHHTVCCISAGIRRVLFQEKIAPSPAPSPPPPAGSEDGPAGGGSNDEDETLEVCAILGCLTAAVIAVLLSNYALPSTYAELGSSKRSLCPVQTCVHTHTHAQTGTASVVVELSNPGFTEEDYNGEA
eukprot:scaffold75197_cov17-Tisochrysis_lutea.AAC.2